MPIDRAKLEQEALEVFDHLARWIDNDSANGPTDDLLEWLRDNDATKAHEPEPDAQLDHYYINAGNSIIYFAHLWYAEGDGGAWTRRYVLERYDRAYKHGPGAN